jgi:hypothetical protein
LARERAELVRSTADGLRKLGLAVPTDLAALVEAPKGEADSNPQG